MKQGIRDPKPAAEARWDGKTGHIACRAARRMVHEYGGMIREQQSNHYRKNPGSNHSGIGDLFWLAGIPVETRTGNKKGGH